MKCKGWLTLLLFLLQSFNAANADEQRVLGELAKSHPNCCLYGHFYAPMNLVRYKTTTTTTTTSNTTDMDPLGYDGYQGDFGRTHTRYPITAK